MAESRKSIAVIDGNSLLHRAFHAIPPSMTTKAGVQTNAVFGFMQMLIKLYERFSPWGIIVAFDKGKPEARLALMPSYKEGRPPLDESLHAQFSLLKELLRGLAIPYVELEGWEGDDLLGTLGKAGEQQGYKMLLVTGDRDMYQLTSEYINVVTTKKGLSDVVIMTPNAVSDLYDGITPELVTDFYGLKGDTSDNIPGVPGVGPKKAAELLQTYGSLEAVLSHADEIPGKMGENIREHKKEALLSKQIATIRCDAPITMDFNDAEFGTYNPDKARAAFGVLEFENIATRFFALSRDPNAIEEPIIQANHGSHLELPEIIEGDEAHNTLDQWIEDGVAVAVSYHANHDRLALEDDQKLFAAADDKILSFNGNTAQEIMVGLVRKADITTLRSKDFLGELYPKNQSYDVQISDYDLSHARFFDVELAAYLLDATNETYGLSELTSTYLKQLIPNDDDPMLGAYEAYGLFLLRPVLERKLDAEGLMTCYREIETPLVPVLLKMERKGMEVSKTELKRQEEAVKAELDQIEQRIYEAAHEEFNIGSPKQLSHVLFDVIGIPSVGIKKTKNGYVSTNAQILEDLANMHPVVNDIVTWREMSKLYTTYLVALPNYIKSDGRIHSSFNQTVTSTGRLSSSDPNLQNIPVRSELGRRVRSAFVVPEGSVLMTADYSQIELRLLAEFSGDEYLREAFISGKDFHAQTAARIFGVALDEVTPLMRSRAKAVNFGIVYGQQAFSLARELKIDRAEAQAMIDSYFKAYPGVRTYLDDIVKKAEHRGYATSYYGRKRLLPELRSKNKMVRAAGAREAMNLPMQGSAADLIKKAMIKVDARLSDEGLNAKLILQVHDELDLEVPKNEIESVWQLVKEEMEGVQSFSVPLVADVAYGDTWASAK